jgi:hypothetical protein
VEWNALKVTDAEITQINRLSRSNWVIGIADSVLRSLDRETLAKMIGGYLYFKSNGRSEKDFIGYMTKKELWATAAIGLNVMSAVIPALLFDKEFRMLAMKTGLSKGSEIASKTAQKKVAQTDLEEQTRKIKRKIKA